MGKKLILKWVSDAIGDDYKNWKKGDVVLLQAQTGTGKTWFFKNKIIKGYLTHMQRLLILCNRIHLKRQLKIDLLKMYHMAIPYIKDKEGNETDEIDLDELDAIEHIENVTIRSYQSLEHMCMNHEYRGTDLDLKYDYIIMDEFHYVLADGAFNNVTRFTYKYLVKEEMSSTIKVFISATMEEMETLIDNAIKNYNTYREPIRYKTGIDYSYVNVKYFKNDWDVIINSIKNDITDEKWLIFVSSKEDGEMIQKDLGDEVSTFIKAGMTNDELKSIVGNSKFNKKVLISTKVLDNGVNIEDDKLTNIVIMSWDRVTFIQQLGRKRVNINDAQEINLWIATRFKKSFTTKVKVMQEQLNEVELLENEENEFNRKYDNNLKGISVLQHLFYKENIRTTGTGEWKINAIGKQRIELDKKFFEEMELEFELDKEFAFVHKQLEWLGLDKTFDEENFIEEVLLDDNVKELEKYLESRIGDVMLKAIDRVELIEKIGLIDTHNSNIKKKTIKYVKNRDTLNSYILKDLNINYYIKEFETSRTENEKIKKYKHAWKVLKMTDEQENILTPLK